MKGVSAIVITFNEADRIESCLKPLAFCDEIIVVDSGSSDRTCDLARKFTDKVVHRDWPGHREQKAYAASIAAGPWILLVDADEIVSDELTREIQALPDNPPENGFLVRRDFYFMNRLIKHGGAWPDYVMRLFRKDKHVFGGSPTHEVVQINGATGKLNAPMRHYSYRNIEDYFKRFNSYTTLAAKDRFERGKKFSFIQNFRIFYEFIVRYFIRLGFLDGYPGFVYAMLSSFYAWTKYSKLKELEDRERERSNVRGAA